MQKACSCFLDSPRTENDGSIVRGFKINSIKKIRELVGRGELQFAPTALKIIEMDYKIWQRNYYEHIIRNEDSIGKIASYIRNNPAKWQEDEYVLS